MDWIKFLIDLIQGNFDFLSDITTKFIQTSGLNTHLFADILYSLGRYQKSSKKQIAYISLTKSNDLTSLISCFSSNHTLLQEIQIMVLFWFSKFYVGI
jgi:hypothetical protein